jgi:hypothetical protein
MKRYVMKKSPTSSRPSSTRTDAAPRKLALARQTLRRLTASDLVEVVGGTVGTAAQITISCVSCDSKG